MNKNVYLSLEIKRSFKHYPHVLIITLVLIAGIALSAFAVLNFSQSDADKQVIRVGVVGNVGDSYLGIGVYAIKKMDSSRFYVDLIEMDEDDAALALENREIAGYVYIPEGFVKGVTRGTNTPLRYVTGDDPAGFGNILENEIVMMVSDLVTQAQKSVYATVKLAKDNGASKGIDKKIDRLNLSYINYVLNRDKAHDLVLTGIKDELGYGGYYVCAVITFFMMIWGISASSILAEKNYELSRLLYSRGVSLHWQIFSKFTGFALIMLATLILFSLCFGIARLMAADALSALVFVIKLIPVIGMFAAMHVMIYEIVSGSVGSILAQFLIAVGLGYVSGIFYPISFFPESMQTLASYLPSGAGFSYIRKTMSGTEVLSDGLLVMLYLVIFYLVSVAARTHKIKGGKMI